MIGDSFTLNDKTYTIKKDITWGEYKKINYLSKKLNEVAEKLGSDIDNTSLPAEQLQQLGKELTQVNDEQLQIMGDFLESVLGLGQSNVDVLSLHDAINLFQEAFKRSTSVNTDLKKTSNSPYS